MIELSALGFTAVILAVVLFTSLIWLGVAVILAGRDKTAERIDAACTLIEMHYGEDE